MKRIYLSTPTMHGEEMQFIQKAFDDNWVAPLGENVDGFEDDLRRFSGTRAAAALTSGTAALHLACILSGIGRNDLVFCTDLTFSASVNPVRYEGGQQVFIDSEYDTWNMDPAALEKAFKKYDGVRLPRPKAVLAVHLYGTPAKIDEIKAICARENVPLIEDAAESLGATHRGQQTGSFGHFGIFSFNGNKIITTSGGGMLVSDDEKAIADARFLATQARDPAPHYQHSRLGYNYRMSNIVAGIGRGQMLHLHEHIQRKREIRARYEQGLKGLPLTLNPLNAQGEANCWLTCLLLDRGVSVHPYRIMERLAQDNIESRPIWKPMHLQPLYENNDFISAHTDVGADIFERGLCLPCDIKMTVQEQDHIISLIKEVLNR